MRGDRRARRGAGTLWFIDFERAGDRGGHPARDPAVVEAVAAPLQAAEMAAAGWGDADGGAEPAGRALHSFSEVPTWAEIRVRPRPSESV